MASSDERSSTGCWTPASQRTRSRRPGIRRAVIASSINEFGVPLNHHDVQPAYYPIDEAIPDRIDDWYSLSKRSGELTAAMAASHWDINVVAIRYPHVSSHADLCRRVAKIARSPGLLAREGWSYLDLRDAVHVALLGLVAPVDGGLVVAVAAEDTLLEADTTTLLDCYARPACHAVRSSPAVAAAERGPRLGHRDRRGGRRSLPGRSVHA